MITEESIASESKKVEFKEILPEKNIRILITGFSGFVGFHFLEYLYDHGIEMEVYGIDIKEPDFDYTRYLDKLSVQFINLNLLDARKLREEFETIRPDYILHLASYSSVAYSWEFPVQSFMNNTNIFLNLIAVVKDISPNCRILSVGSSEEYGNVSKNDLPLRENHPLKPVSPYGVARMSQEMLSNIFVESYHMNIVLTRSFNHIGPRQDERFVIPAFIRKILNIKQVNGKEGVIETGDTGIVRDFVDVRDVVEAYYLLLLKGKSGELYNICSGTGVRLHEIIGIIAEKMQVKIIEKITPGLVRPNDNMVIIGSNSKITDELGWRPKRTLEQSIQDMLDEMVRE